MRRTLINITLFAFFLTLGTRGFGQIQTYHNGFVAATNKGVYYLMDGDNQWLSFGNISRYNFPSSDNYIRDQDTISAVSCNGKNITLFSIGKGVVTDGGDQGRTLNVYGNKLFKEKTIGLVGTEITHVLTKNLSNKFKAGINWAKIFFADYRALDVSLNIDGVNSSYYYSIVPLIYFTSLATDNDSILVWTGTNNTLYKTVISPTVGYRSNTAISGLTSSASSGHQICYDSNNDLFWIVSDEGFVYTYNKVAITKVDTVHYGIHYIDTIMDLKYDKFNDRIVASVNGVSSSKCILVQLHNEWCNVGWTGVNDQIAIDNKGNILTDADYVGELLIYGINPDNCTGNNEKDIADLPLGTVVYDLDYIDYLP